MFLHDCTCKTGMFIEGGNLIEYCDDKSYNSYHWMDL